MNSNTQSIYQIFDSGVSIEVPFFQRSYHLDLIHIISDIQDSYVMTDTSMEFKQLLDIELTERGLIGKRKPNAVKTDSKGSYVRDELKLWNKFGLLQCKNNRYFDKDKDLTFNWQKITEVLTNGKQW